MTVRPFTLMHHRIATFLTLALLAATLHAEDGAQAWLRYAPPQHGSPSNAIPVSYQKMPAALVNLDSSPEAASAQTEILRGVRSMLGRTLRIETKVPTNDDAWILATTAELHTALPEFRSPASGPEGFSISTVIAHGHQYWVIAGADPRGILYGAFHVLTGIARGQTFAQMQGTDSPSAPVRWVNQWDNLNGTIERGYAGRSIFFDNGQIRTDLTRAREYARLLASIGINGCTINNVNADPRLLNMIPDLARVADVFRPWGVRLSISVAINSPQASAASTPSTPAIPGRRMVAREVR